MVGMYRASKARPLDVYYLSPAQFAVEGKAMAERGDALYWTLDDAAKAIRSSANFAVQRAEHALESAKAHQTAAHTAADGLKAEFKWGEP